LPGVDTTLVAHLDARVVAELPARLGAAAGRIETSDLQHLRTKSAVFDGRESGRTR